MYSQQQWSDQFEEIGPDGKQRDNNTSDSKILQDITNGRRVSQQKQQVFCPNVIGAPMIMAQRFLERIGSHRSQDSLLFPLPARNIAMNNETNLLLQQNYHLSSKNGIENIWQSSNQLLLAASSTTGTSNNKNVVHLRKQSSQAKKILISSGRQSRNAASKWQTQKHSFSGGNSL